MTTIKIHDAIFSKIPTLAVYGLAVYDSNLQNATNFDFFNEINSLTINQDRSENIITLWKGFHKNYGSYKKARSSVEYLCKAKDNNKLRKIEPLVDIYNFVSLKNLCPLGGEDMDTIGNELILKLADGDEPFIPLMSTEIENPIKDEFVWANGNAAIVCRSMNWVESDKFKITKQSKNVVFLTEQPSALFPDGALAIANLKALFENLNIATNMTIFKIDMDTPSIDI
jgi:DNA/RNA-binding domain of Phe-tRNA-synthetase-like protein